jgi:uncharacterized protein
VLRALVPADHAAVRALNDAAVPAVNALTSEALAALVDQGAYARVIADGDTLLALLLVFAPGAAYDSANYAWFSARYARFLYVDRIVVAESARGQGLGARLYDDLAAFARARGVPCLLAEVNRAPPNPGSERFHRREGFTEVGLLDHAPDADGCTKRTVMLHRAL